MNVGTQKLPVVRQAGSKDPVRRLVVDSERKTAAEKVAGHRRDAWGWRGSEGPPAEGNTRKPRALGIASVRQGRRPQTAANPGEAESARVGVTEARRRP